MPGLIPRTTYAEKNPVFYKFIFTLKIGPALLEERVGMRSVTDAFKWSNS